MKKILFPILVLISVACASPQVTVTSEVTVTLAPTEILIPTPTSYPEFIDLQTQFAQSEHFTLNGSGELEAENPDGTISIVKNIKDSDKNGELTIIDGDEEIKIKSFAIDEYTIKLIDEDDRTWIWDGNSLVHSYFENELAQMTPEEKLEAAPETIGDLERGNLSTVKNKFVIYRDESGNAIKVFNLLTAQELSLLEAGIGEADLVDGSKLEALAFSDNQQVMDFITKDAMWFEGERIDFQVNYPELKEVIKEMFQTRDSILGIIPRNGFGLFPPYPEAENATFFEMFAYTIEDNGVVAIFIQKIV